MMFTYIIWLIASFCMGMLAGGLIIYCTVTSVATKIANKKIAQFIKTYNLSKSEE